MKKKCPLCPKEYQSEKDLDKHCKKIHNLTLKEARYEGGISFEDVVSWHDYS